MKGRDGKKKRKTKRKEGSGGSKEVQGGSGDHEGKGREGEGREGATCVTLFGLLPSTLGSSSFIINEGEGSKDGGKG